MRGEGPSPLGRPPLLVVLAHLVDLLEHGLRGLLLGVLVLLLDVGRQLLAVRALEGALGALEGVPLVVRLPHVSGEVHDVPGLVLADGALGTDLVAVVHGADVPLEDGGVDGHEAAHVALDPLRVGMGLGEVAAQSVRLKREKVESN